MAADRITVTQVSAPPAAFFDVDQTLVTFKSMFRFLAFYLRDRGEPSSSYQRIAGGLQQAAANGAPRAEVNRRYYTTYAGEDAARLSQAGAAWFAEELQGDPFVPATLSELSGLRERSCAITLLSGSFFACLDPIAEYVGASWVIGTRPIIRRGKLTGEVVTPLIGEAKGRAVRAAAVIRGIDRDACTAYADDSTDLPMLCAVGQPVVVGDDEVLLKHARRGKWRTLPVPRQPGDGT
jgi:HAD superfamily hydrolase (TIGR01490 family)